MAEDPKRISIPSLLTAKLKVTIRTDGRAISPTCVPNRTEKVVLEGGEAAVLCYGHRDVFLWYGDWAAIGAVCT